MKNSKSCTHCKEVKPLYDYHSDKYAKDGKRWICKKCAEKQRRELYRKDPQKYRNLRKNFYYKNLEESRKKAILSNKKSFYGLEPEAFKEMVRSQNSKCLICSRSSDKLHVDHDHKTKEIRGLLCLQCNVGLGMFGDNPIVLQSALDYLRSGKIICLKSGKQKFLAALT